MKTRLLLALALTSVIVALGSTSAGAVSCGDEFTGAAKSSEWSNAENWSTKALPTEATVVCWASNLTPVVNSDEKVASISDGGGLTIEGQTLTLVGSGETSTLAGKLTLDGGELAGNGTVHLEGAFEYNHGEFATNMHQTGGGKFLVNGNTTAYFVDGKTIETESPVEIEDPDFISNGTTLRTTSTITLAPYKFGANGGDSMKMFAAGFITTGPTEVPNYELNVTGDLSKIQAERFEVPVFNTAPGTTVSVTSGAELSTSGGTIQGTISGVGSYRAAGYKTTVESGGGISLSSATFEDGTLDVKPGATYEISGETKVGSGTLTLEGPGSTGSYTETGGSAGGAGPLTINGDIAWSGGESSVNMKQASGHTFKVTGTNTAYSTAGATIETEDPVEIEDPSFISNGTTLKTTSTITFAPIKFGPNGGDSFKMFAAGFITSGATEIPNYDLTATGTSSKIEGGRLTVPVFNMAAASKATIASGAALMTTGGAIKGEITGAGTFGTTGYGATVESGGKVTTSDVLLEGGTLDVDSGTTYTVDGETKLAGGTLKLEASGSTGAYTETAGSDEGSGLLTITGAFAWSGGGVQSPLKQTGGGACAITGSTTAYLYGGSIETESPVEISNPDFITANSATVTTTSTIDLAKGFVMAVNGGDNATFSAAGLGANTGATYGLGADSLVLTGGKTTVPAGSKLENGPITIQAGELAVEGEVEPSVRLTGGKLAGTGTVEGSLTNASGTVEAGAEGFGVLHVSGSYIQEAGGTLDVNIKGTTPGSEFGQIFTAEDGEFAGSISVRDEGGFTPARPERFLIIETRDGNSGAFEEPSGESGSLYEAASEVKGAFLAVAPPPAPVNTKAPGITGSDIAGETVSCSTGTWSNAPESYAYEWLLEGVAIAGQSSETLALSAEEEGKKVICVVTARNETGKASAQSPSITVSAPPVPIPAPENKAAPSISGQTEAGDELVCSAGSWTGSPSYTYQWSREGVTIAGATGSSYKITEADEGHTLTCTVTASNGKTAQATSTAIAVPKPSLQLSCAKRSIVLVSVVQSGHSVLLSGFALRKYAGKKVAITISDVPKKYARGKGGTTVVAADGSFTAKLPLPKGKLAPLTRYTATVEGQASIGLKLGRNLVITAEAPGAGATKVSFHFVGARGPGKGVVQITRQESCTQNKVIATAKLSKANTLTVTLPAPATAGETSYYRAQTKIKAGITYSLPIAVTND